MESENQRSGSSQRRPTSRCGLRAATPFEKLLDDHTAARLVVIHEENMQTLEASVVGRRLLDAIRGLLQGNLQPELGALPLDAVEADPASHQIAELTRNAEPQTRAPVISGHGGVSLPEGLEDLVPESFGNPDSGVFHRKPQRHDLLVLGDHADLDHDLALTRELNGVCREIQEDLPQAKRITDAADGDR